MSNKSGWQALQESQSQIVPNWWRPKTTCKYCGKPIYFIKLYSAKHGDYWATFEDAGHGSKDDKVLLRHKCKH